MAIYTKPEEEERRKGSKGGSTFTRTCNGFIIRRRFQSKQPNTIIQKQQRSKFASAAQHFRTLNGTQKTSFQTASNLFPRTDSLGNEYFLNGQQHQILVNQNLELLQQSKRNTGALPFSFPTFGVTGGAANTSPPQIILAFDPDPIPSPLAMHIYLSPIGYYTFENFPFNLLRLVRTLNPSTSSPVNLTANYVQRFGLAQPQPEQQIAVAFKLVHATRGEQSSYAIVLLGFI